MKLYNTSVVLPNDKLILIRSPRLVTPQTSNNALTLGSPGASFRERVKCGYEYGKVRYDKVRYDKVYGQA